MLVIGVISGGIAAAAASAAPTAPVTQAANNRVPTSLPPASNSESNLQPNTTHLLRLVEYLFPYYKSGGAIYGYRQDPIPDHPSGQALDIMMANDGRDAASVREGNLIAAFLMANASQLGVDYMIWRGNIWYPGRDWRQMSDRGNWTDNHMNHIHVLVFGGFTATDNLVMPSELKGIADGLPDGEALRIEHEQRVAHQLAVAAAMTTLTERTAHLKVIQQANSKHAAVLLGAQQKVNGTARQSYMLGMDAELLARSVVLLDAPAIDPAVLVAAERVLRVEDAEVESSLEIVSVTRRQLSRARATVVAAQSDLSAARQALAQFERAHA
jgi:hypothetical protein